MINSASTINIPCHALPPVDIPRQTHTTTHSSLNRVSFSKFKEYTAKMSSISLLNPKAEFARASQALAINISAAKGLQDVMKMNLGPKGTLKM